MRAVNATLDRSTINTAMVSNVTFECLYWSIIINTIKLEKWCHVECILSMHVYTSVLNIFWPILFCFSRQGMDSSAWVRQYETPCVVRSCGPLFHRHASLHLARVHLKRVSPLLPSNVIMCFLCIRSYIWNPSLCVLFGFFCFYIQNIVYITNLH